MRHFSACTGHCLEVEGTISLHGVHFTYPTRPNEPVLKGLTAEFPAGKTIALVGASGCVSLWVLHFVAWLL